MGYSEGISPTFLKTILYRNDEWRLTFICVVDHSANQPFECQVLYYAAASRVLLNSVGRSN